MDNTSSPHIGYCTNVHAGADLTTMRDNLERYAIPARQSVNAENPMGIGLWLSAKAARSLQVDDETEKLARWLESAALIPFTLNGFPYGDFHQTVVKHRVYHPTWYENDRLEYTLNLIDILDQILPSGLEGSISTLPIGWGQPEPSGKDLKLAAAQFQKVVEHLHQLEQERGRLIYVCIEPEPGCVLQTSTDIVQFFENQLSGQIAEHQAKRYVRVCHDVCHSSVMFETQKDVLQRYQAAGILVGKVQISSAIQADWSSMHTTQKVEAFQQLRAFAEDRYLHQTVAATEYSTTVFHEDLPDLLQSTSSPKDLQGEWRIHFHVPIFLEQFGLLKTTHSEISECLDALVDIPERPHHFEVETYAWGVLPAELQESDLSRGIAKELNWFVSLLKGVRY